MVHYIMPPISKHKSKLIEGAIPPPCSIDTVLSMMIIHLQSVLLQSHPLDNQIDVSKLSFGQQEEPSWGSNAPRPLRHDPYGFID